LKNTVENMEIPVNTVLNVFRNEIELAVDIRAAERIVGAQGKCKQWGPY